jgi:hypothetical protein
MVGDHVQSTGWTDTLKNTSNGSMLCAGSKIYSSTRWTGTWLSSSGSTGTHPIHFAEASRSSEAKPSSEPDEAVLWLGASDQALDHYAENTSSNRKVWKKLLGYQMNEFSMPSQCIPFPSLGNMTCSPSDPYHLNFQITNQNICNFYGTGWYLWRVGGGGVKYRIRHFKSWGLFQRVPYMVEDVHLYKNM